MKTIISIFPFTALRTFIALSLSLLVLLGCAATEDTAARADPTVLNNALKLAIEFDGQFTVSTDLDASTGIVAISELTNTCTSPACVDSSEVNIASLGITEEDPEVFTLSAGAVNIDISDPVGAATATGVNLGTFTITAVADDAVITYTVTADYMGLPVEELVDALSGDNGIADLVSAELGTQSSSTASYNADDNLLTISSLFNTDNDGTSGTVTIDAALPAGYYFTSATFTDPAGTDAAPNTAATALLIAEGDEATQTVIANNEVSYNVQIDFLAFVLADVLSNAIQVTLVDTTALVPTHTVTLDEANNSGTVIITGITNNCPDYTSGIPCTDAATTALGDITITEDDTAFTLSASPVTIDIPDPVGAATVTGVNLGTFTITNAADNAVITYTVTVDYMGLPIGELVDALSIGNGIIDLVSAELGEQSSTTAAFANDVLTISNFFNTADDTETGTVSFNAALPTGYYFTPATFTNPAGTDAGTYAAATVLNITEGDEATLSVTSGNQVSYNVQIAFLANFVLADVLSAATAITLTDTPTPAPTTTVDVANGTITITGITNDCPDYTSDIPCADAATTALGDITITETSSVFTIQSGTELILSVDDVTGAQSSSFTNNDVLTITTVLDESFTFDVIIEYSGIAVADIVTSIGLTAVLPVSLVSVTLGDQTSTDADWVNNVLTISNILNLPDETPVVDGLVTIDLPSAGPPSGLTTQNPITILLPAGYYVTPNSSYAVADPDDNSTNAELAFTDPADSDATNLDFADVITIAEGDETTQSVTADNDASYALTIILSALPSSAFVLKAEDLAISTFWDDDLPVLAINSEHLAINLATSTVTITADAGIRNLLQFNVEHKITLNASQTGSNKFTLTETTIIIPSDKDGTESYKQEDAGTFTITPTDSSNFTYTLDVVLGVSYVIPLSTSPTGSISGDVMFIPVPAYDERVNVFYKCQKLTIGAPYTVALDNVTKNQTSNLTVTSDPQLFGYPTTTNISDTYTFTVRDTNNDIISESNEFSIYLAGSGLCDKFAGGNGSSGNPWRIDSDIRLDRMSRLVNADDTVDGTNHRNKHYILTADIDMNNANAPWGDGDNGKPWVGSGTEKNGFVPIGKVTNSTNSDAAHQQSRSFTGTLDCASNTISNLFISNTNADLSAGYDGTYLGLFAFIDTGAAITDCTLVNANITGDQYVGGLVGQMLDGTVSGNMLSNINIAVSANTAGGLVGNTTGGTISSNVVIGADIISGGGSYIGGLIGTHAGGSVSSSFIAASVTGGLNIGGLAGTSTAAITNSYFTGSVTSSGVTTPIAGGGVAHGTGSLTNVYTTATVTATTKYGLAPSGTAVASYWDSTISGTTTAGAGVGKTTAELQAVATGSGEIYADWSTDVWDFTADQYPALKGLRLSVTDQRSADDSYTDPTP